ncbi:MAG: hypothetical protein Q4G49_01250, partial [Paracoccus sp. (in: a-proteobacteria)]|nr:hypothetical protein [Paracoccus sp. (in: a-proteobacteria)]
MFAHFNRLAVQSVKTLAKTIICQAITPHSIAQRRQITVALVQALLQPADIILQCLNFGLLRAKLAGGPDPRRPMARNGTNYSRGDQRGTQIALPPASILLFRCGRLFLFDMRLTFTLHFHPYRQKSETCSSNCLLYLPTRQPAVAFTVDLGGRAGQS